MTDRVKIFLMCSLITMQNLVVISDTVCAHVGGPRTLREAGALPTLDGGVADPLETRYSPHVLYYHISSL